MSSSLIATPHKALPCAETRHIIIIILYDVLIVKIGRPVRAVSEPKNKVKRKQKKKVYEETET